jgi:Flp pilus assembly protein TadG
VLVLTPAPSRRWPSDRPRGVRDDDVRAERGRGDDGLSTVEAVFTVPVMVLMVLAIVQAALWWYARQVASTAADEAARAARAYASTAAAGESRGADYMTTVDPDNSTLRARHVQVTRTATTVTVHVTGQVASLIPFLNPGVSITITAPVERYVPSG